MTSTEVLTHSQSQQQQVLKRRAQTIETSLAPSQQQPSAILMETLQSIRHQVSGQTQDLHQRASHQFEHLRNWLTRNLLHLASTLREYANTYPPFAAFLFSLIVLSAIPVGIYLAFAVCTSVAVLTLALLGFVVVEGAMLICSGGLLLAILGCIAFFTTVLFAFISLFYAGYRVALTLFDRVYQVGSSFGAGTTDVHPSSHQPHSADTDASMQTQ